MAVRGPKEGRQKTKAQSQDSSQNATPVAVFKISDLKNANLPDSCTPIVDAIQMVGEMTLFAQAYIKIAQVDNLTERNTQVATLFEQHASLLEKSTDKFINTIAIHFDLHNIPYEKMYQEIWKLYEEINQLQKQKDPNQIQLASLMQKLDQAYLQSEALLLLANQKINAWIMLLSHPQTQTTQTRHTLISRLFLDLCPMITYMVRQFIYTNLRQHHYYLYYQILMEKIGYFEQYLETYINVLLDYEKGTDPKKTKYRALEIAFLEIFNANGASSLLLKLFDKQERALSVDAKQTQYLEKIEQISLKTKTPKENIESRKRQYKISDIFKETEKDPMPLCVFLELDALYQRDWCQISKSEYKGCLEGFKEVAKATKIGLEGAGNAILFPEMLLVYIRGVFAILSPYKMMSQEQISDEIIMILLKVVTSLIELFRNETYYKGFYLLSAEGIFKQIATDLTTDLKKYLAEKRKQEAEEKALCIALNRLDLVSMEATEEKTADVPLALPLVPPSAGVPEACSVEETKHNLPEACDNQETTEKELEEKCKEDLSQQQTDYEERSRLLLSKRIQEREVFSKRMQEDYAAKVQLLEAAYQAELTKEKEQFEKYKERKVRQYGAKDEAVVAKHQLKLKELAEEFDAARQNVLTLHEKERTEQSNQQKAELATLNAEQVARLNDAKQANAEDLGKLMASHTALLEKMRTEHAAELASCKTGHESRLRELKDKNKAEQAAALASHKASLAKAKGEQAADLAKCQEEGQNEIKAQIAKNEQALAQNAAEFALKLSEQRALNQSNLERLSQEHVAELEKAKRSLRAMQEADALQFKQEREKMLAAQTAKSTWILEKLKNELAIKQPWLKTIQAYDPIGTIAVPADISVLQDLDILQFEAYIVGGWVRNRLMNLPFTAKEDSDVIVNCEASELPESIRNQCWQNPNEPKHLKIGNIDLWCEKWSDLKERLQKRDFSINTFICSFQGHVFDILGFRNDLFNPFLRILGNTRARFSDDPSLMLRTIRFSNQLNKTIAEEDIDCIRELSKKMTEMPIGIYISNLKKLFVSPLAIQNLAIILRLGILPNIVPSLPTRIPDFDRFWEHKLFYFSAHSEACDGYHVLALFLLIPLLKLNPKHDELIPAICRCINSFIAHYRKEMTEQEKNKIRGWVKDIITAPEGLYEQYLQYQQMMAKAAESLTQANEAVVYTPHYQQNGRRSREPVNILSYPVKPSRNRSAKN